jgi:hypothetical protein
MKRESYMVHEGKIQEERGKIFLFLKKEASKKKFCKKKSWVKH